MKRFGAMAAATTIARRVTSIAAALLMTITIGGAVAVPVLSEAASGDQDRPPSADWFDVGMPHIAKRGDAYVFVHSIESRDARNRFWALVEVNNPDGTRRCEWLKIIEPKQKYRFECPVEGSADKTYASRLRVYNNDKLSDRKMLYEPELRASAEALAAADKAGDTPDGKAIVVRDDVFEALESVMPATFKPTWYRRIDKGFSLRAYEHSGDLTVSPDELLFVDDKKTVRIPYARMESVRWEPMANDIANHWVVVRFTNEDGKTDGVAFRDGGRLGMRQGTGMIYQTLRRAAKK